MPVGASEYRELLGRFASGVTLVTVSAGERLHGMTASAFAAVSLEPPLVLVCLERASRTRGLILEVGAFAVNILSTGEEQLARAFAGSGPKSFDEIAYGRGSSGAPLLEDAVATVECRVHSVVESGDHDVVFGEVTETDVRGGSPLVYYRRSYRSLSE